MSRQCRRSKPLDRTRSRAASSARTCRPTSSSKPAPAPARRRCSPSAWPPASRPAPTRSSTSPPSPSRARPRRSCADVSTWRWRRSSRARRQGLEPRRSARTPTRVSTRARQPRALLRRHHPFLLRPPAARAPRRVRRLSRLHRAGRGAGRGAAQPLLARLHHQHAGAPATGHAGAARDRRPPAATSSPRSRSSAATRTSSSRRAMACVRIRSRRGRRSRSSGRSWRSCCRRRSTTSTTCQIQKAARQFRAQLRVPRKKLDRPAVDRGAARHLGLQVHDHSEVVGRLDRREEALQGRDRARCTAISARRPSTPYLRSGGSMSIACRSRCSRAPATSPRTSAAAATR